MHPDKLICQLVLNLKMSITKVTGVSFGTPKDYMLQNLKMMPLTSDLGNSNSTTNGIIAFHLCSYSKLVSPIIFTFHQNKSLKKL